MSNPKSLLEVTPAPVTISAPVTGDNFDDGDSTGQFWPSTSGNDITLQFWQFQANYPAQKPSVTLAAMASNQIALVWTDGMSVSAFPTQTGYLVATNSTAPTKTYAVGSLVVTGQRSQDGEVMNRIHIDSPHNACVVGHAFFVRGISTPGDGYSVEVQVIPPAPTLLGPIVIPPLLFADGHWVAGVVSIAGGDYFRIVAVLKDKYGNKLSQHSVANIEIR